VTLKVPTLGVAPRAVTPAVVRAVREPIELKVEKPEIKHETKVAVAVVSVVPVVGPVKAEPANKKQETPIPVVAVVPAVSNARKDLLLEIERQGRLREERIRAQQAQQVSAPVVPVVLVPVVGPVTPGLPNLTPEQEQAAELKRAMEKRRRELEEDHVWDNADD